jgi:hypothetical protein
MNPTCHEHKNNQAEPSLQNFLNQDRNKGRPNPKFKLWTKKKKQNMTSARQEFNRILLQNEKKKRKGCDKKRTQN